MAYVSDNVDLAGLIVTVTFALFGAVVAYFEKTRTEDRRRADEARAEDRRRADETLAQDRRLADEARAEDRRARDALAKDVRHSMRRMDSHAKAASRVELLWTSLGTRVVVQPQPLTASSPPPASPGATSAADARRRRRSSRFSR